MVFRSKQKSEDINNNQIVSQVSEQNHVTRFCGDDHAKYDKMTGKLSLHDPNTTSHAISVITNTPEIIPVVECSPVDKLAKTNSLKTHPSYSTLPHNFENNSEVREETLTDEKPTELAKNKMNDSVDECETEKSIENYYEIDADARDNVESDNVEAVNENVIKTSNPNLIFVNNDFVMNIKIGSQEKEECQDQPTLSACILDEVEENSFDEKKHSNKAVGFEPQLHFDLEQSFLSAIILEGHHQLKGPQSIVSREKILKKLHNSTSYPTHNPQEVPTWKLSNLLYNQKQHGQIQETKQVDDDQTLNQRPSAKILERLYSTAGNENTYVSLTGDSLYQSLHNELEDGGGDPKDDLVLCPVLAANLVATHAESVHHAEITRCQDCAEYAAGLHNIVQHLQIRHQDHWLQVRQFYY